MEFHLQEF